MNVGVDGSAIAARYRFDHASLNCEHEAIGDVLSRSTDIGWTSVLVTRISCLLAGGTFETKPTPDLRIMILVAGELDLEILGNGIWRRSRLRPGASITIPGGRKLLIRLDNRRPAVRAELLNLFIPRPLVDEVKECREDLPEIGSGERLSPSPTEDAAIASVGLSLLTAIDRNFADFYAEAAARWLATHVLTRRSGEAILDDLRNGVVGDRNVARAIEFMSAHLPDPLTLDKLAREAGMSKFHFSRRFKSQTGVTPFLHLAALRLEAGRRMLATTDDPIGRIANACGYERGSHFGTAFARRFGETPSAFRRRSRL